jgi:hypothetical protein
MRMRACTATSHLTYATCVFFSTPTAIWALYRRQFERADNLRLTTKPRGPQSGRDRNLTDAEDPNSVDSVSLTLRRPDS